MYVFVDKPAAVEDFKIAASVMIIADTAFAECVNLEDISYPGSSEGWASILNVADITGAPTDGKLPIIGEIACGSPIFATENIDGYASPCYGVSADFCLLAKGDSMIGARIYDGDLVFIKKQPRVENGEIAAVLIDDRATLKRVYLYPQESKLVLAPENPKYKPLVFVGEELLEIQILGKAVAFQSEAR